MHRRWHTTAARLLGLPRQDWFGADYITHAPVWHRQTLLALREQVADVTGMRWQQAVARSWNFSEFTLYGIYAEHVALPTNERDFFPTDCDLAHSSWKYDVGSTEGRASFVGDLAPHHLVIGIQSKEKLTATDRRLLVESLESAARAF